jgi:hypothetical protein
LDFVTCTSGFVEDLASSTAHEFQLKRAVGYMSNCRLRFVMRARALVALQ